MLERQKNPVVVSHYLNKASYLNLVYWVFPNFNDGIALSLFHIYKLDGNFIVDVYLPSEVAMSEVCKIG